MLEISGLDVHYGKNHVVKGLSLELNDGEVVSLIGMNAAGKTTTLRTVMGLLSPTSGRIRFRGEDIGKLATVERVRRGLALVPEGRQIFPKFTVLENLLMGAYHRSDRGHLDGDLTTIFDMFPRLAERRNQKAGSMSGGEQQMLAIGRGLIAKPKCLLLDEPTLGLAPIVVDEILQIVRTLAQQGMTILLAEQNASVALAVADRAYVIESGRVAMEGGARDLVSNEAVRRNYLGT
jgi:branched-chain amino acid transport system ATP-binding protein